MRVLCWNVNGIRAIVSKLPGGLKELFSKYDVDIACFQETKAHSLTLLDDDIVHVPGYESFLSFCTTKKGYSGVVTFVKKGTTYDAEANPFKVKEFDSEGRCLITDHHNFVVINVYFPNGRQRDQYQMGFCKAFSDLCDQLHKNGKAIIVTGDINISHQKIDVYDPKKAKEEEWPAFRKGPRKWFTEFLEKDFVDTFRHFYPSDVKFTCWDVKKRFVDQGCRIDYFLVSSKFIPSVLDSEILSNQFGSDHCPVCLLVKEALILSEQPPVPLSSDYQRKKQLSLMSFLGNNTLQKSEITRTTTTTTTATLITTATTAKTTKARATTITTTKEVLEMQKSEIVEDEEVNTHQNQVSTELNKKTKKRKLETESSTLDTKRAKQTSLLSFFVK